MESAWCGRAVERKSPPTSSVPDLGQAAVSLGAFGEPARTAGGRATFLQFFAERLSRPDDRPFHARLTILPVISAGVTWS